MTARAPALTLHLIRTALENGGSCRETELRLCAAAPLVRAVFAYLLGQGPEPEPCAHCGGSGWNHPVVAEFCPRCRGIGMSRPEA
jgi:hypothetical protein